MNHPEDDSRLPSLEALLAGTLALMTTWADPHLKDRVVLTRHRDLIARKIVSNLHFLQNHPAVSQELRIVLNRSHDRWASLAHPDCTCNRQTIEGVSALPCMPPGSTLIH